MRLAFGESLNIRNQAINQSIQFACDLSANKNFTAFIADIRRHIVDTNPILQIVNHLSLARLYVATALRTLSDFLCITHLFLPVRPFRIWNLIQPSLDGM